GQPTEDAKSIVPGTVGFSRVSGGSLLQIQHRPPDGQPFPAAGLEHPKIATRRAVSFGGTLLNHLLSEPDDSPLIGETDVRIVLVEFVNRGTPTEVVEPGKELIPSLDPPREIGEDHDDLGVDPLGEVFHATLEPGLVDSTHGCGRNLASGFSAHEGFP